MDRVASGASGAAVSIRHPAAEEKRWHREFSCERAPFGPTRETLRVIRRRKPIPLIQLAPCRLFGWRRALGAGTNRAQQIVGIDSGGVAVAEGNLDGILP